MKPNSSNIYFPTNNIELSIEIEKFKIELKKKKKKCCEKFKKSKRCKSCPMNC